MEKNEKAVIVQDIYKSFYIPKEVNDTLVEYISNPFRLFRKEKFEVLKDISFTVNHGEFISIIGRNGSGKSTLLKILAGVYNPDAGKVTINGHLVPFLQLGVGFNPDLTARENVFLNGAILGIRRKYLKEKFDEIIDFAELHKFVDLPVKNFSSGMYVRLAFSIAIIADADIYLLDEVLSVGDASFQKKSKAVFERFIKEGKTIILVSHGMEQVRELSDRTLLLEGGRIIADGKPEEVTEQYEALMGAS